MAFKKDGVMADALKGNNKYFKLSSRAILIVVQIVVTALLISNYYIYRELSTIKQEVVRNRQDTAKNSVELVGLKSTVESTSNINQSQIRQLESDIDQKIAVLSDYINSIEALAESNQRIFSQFQDQILDIEVRFSELRTNLADTERQILEQQ